jgi:hypothetical protein
MAFGNGPKISTNGLVLALDAANTNSYSGSGTTWTDLSGKGNSATLINGPTFNSANGGSIVFDGTNDLGEIPANASNILTTLTMEAWFKANGTPSGGYHVLFQKEGGFSGGSVYGLRAIPSSTFYAMICYDAQSGNENTLSSTTTLTNGIWYYVASTFDSSYNWKIYINGVLENSSTLSAVPFQNSSVIRVGLGDSRYTNGNIATVRVYNQALTPTQILQNYNATKTRFGL